MLRLQKSSFTLFLITGLLLPFVLPQPRIAVAQSGCPLVINEIMYDPAAGFGNDAQQEWVELYVATTMPVDATFFLTDQDAPAAGVFNKTFSIPAGTAAGTYIVVHNDGDPNNDGLVSNEGIYTTISFFMGNNSVKLNNNGDEVVLYLGSETDGRPCDYVEYLTPNSTMPPGFRWDASCGNPGSAQPFGTSISLDPNGSLANGSCNWTESGLNSPDDPGIPNTGGPDTRGYNNNTTPTAVSLASFSTSQQQPGMVLLALMSMGMVGMTLFVKRRRV